MVTELFETVASWKILLLAIGTFGFVPGLSLRLLVKIYPANDPRREELVAELYTINRIERPLFVAEQLETVLSEGLPNRVREVRLKVQNHARKFGRYWGYAGFSALTAASTVQEFMHSGTLWTPTLGAVGYAVTKMAVVTFTRLRKQK